MVETALREAALSLGAHNAAFAGPQDVLFDASLRDLCVSNACGQYGMCWTCPPDAGDVHALIAQARAFSRALMYQAVYPLEDSFDIEGMTRAGEEFNHLARALHRRAREGLSDPFLHLAAGACRACEACSRRDNLPCVSPEEALSSLEAYGINVYETARKAGLKYVNGPNTVTYFGMLFF